MNQDLIWDYYQNELPEAFSASRARLLFLVKKLKTNGRVLNVGIGTGVFEDLAAELGLDVYSLDPSERSIAALRQRMGSAEKAKVGYGQEIPFTDRFFDAVVVSEVIEHLTPEITHKTLSEISRVLVPGGRVLGTVPARENLTDQIVVCPDCGKRFHRWGHLQTFDSDSIRALLSQYFEIDEVLERYFVTWSALNWKGKATAFIKLSLGRIGIHGCGEWLYFGGRKR